MRWYALLSLLSDKRVKFLLWFVIAAIAVAGVLTFIEIRLKRKREKQLAEKADESVIEKMRKYLEYDKTPREKLDFVDKASKEYFKEVYGTHAKSSYSTLIQEFEKTKRGSELVFCKAMFETYYSHKELTDDRVIALGNLLIEVNRKKKKADEISRVPPFMERVERFFAKRRVIVANKRQVRAEENHIRRIENERISERNKNLKVVLKREKVVRKNRIIEARNKNADVIAERRKFRIETEKKARTEEFIEAKAEKNKKKLANVVSKKRKVLLKNKAIELRIARAKILIDEANFKKEKARRDKVANVAVNKLASEKVKKLKEFEKSQVRERKVVFKKEKVDRIEAEKAVVIAKKESAEAERKARVENVLAEKEKSGKRSMFGNIFLQKENVEEVDSDEKKTMGIAERIVNNARVRSERIILGR